MKKRHTFLLIWIAISIPSLFGVRGCGTSMLTKAMIDDNYSLSPKPIKYERGFSKGNNLLIEFLANNPRALTPVEKKYYAKGILKHYEDAPSPYELKWTVSSEPFSQDQLDGAYPIIVDDVSKLTDKKGCDEIFKYIKNNAPTDRPSLYYESSYGNYVYVAFPEIGAYKWHMITFDSIQGVTHQYFFGGVGIVLFWPFAVIVDVITSPIWVLLPDRFIDG